MDFVVVQYRSVRHHRKAAVRTYWKVFVLTRMVDVESCQKKGWKVQGGRARNEEMLLCVLDILDPCFIL